MWCLFNFFCRSFSRLEREKGDAYVYFPLVVACLGRVRLAIDNPGGVRGAGGVRVGCGVRAGAGIARGGGGGGGRSRGCFRDLAPAGGRSRGKIDVFAIYRRGLAVDPPFFSRSEHSIPEKFGGD